MLNFLTYGFNWFIVSCDSQRGVERSLVAVVESSEIDGLHGRVEYLLASFFTFLVGINQWTQRFDLFRDDVGIGPRGRWGDQQLCAVNAGLADSEHPCGNDELLARLSILRQRDRQLRIFICTGHHGSVREDADVEAGLARQPEIELQTRTFNFVAVHLLRNFDGSSDPLGGDFPWLIDLDDLPVGVVKRWLFGMGKSAACDRQSGRATTEIDFKRSSTCL